MGQNIYAELMPTRTRIEFGRRKDIGNILTTKSCCFDEVEDFFVADKSGTKTYDITGAPYWCISETEAFYFGAVNR
jgi:hypothetical protein